jgi:hypothetical protein
LSGYQTIVMILAVASAVAALLFSSYLALGFKSPSRPAIRAAAIAATLGALAFSAIAFTVSLTPELYEIRGLPTLITGVPVNMALAYIARKQARSMRGALNRPRVQFVLFWAPYVLALDWVLTLTLGVAFPRQGGPPALSDPRSLGDLLHLLWLSLPEVPYILLFAALFFEASGPATPSLRLRTRNLLFSLGAACLFVFCCLEVVMALSDMFSPASLIAPVGLVVTGIQSVLLVLSAVFWLSGGAVHYQKTAIDDWVARAQRWSELRERIGAARHKVRFVSVHPIERHRFFIKVAARKLALSTDDLQKATHAWHLICALEPEQNRRLEDHYRLGLSRTDLSECADLQEDLISKQHLSGPVRWTLKNGGYHVVYDLQEDSVYQALRPVLRLTDSRTHLGPTDSPAWSQLAAVAAAEAELLPTPKARAVRQGQIVDRKILVAYAAAQYFQPHRVS